MSSELATTASSLTRAWPAHTADTLVAPAARRLYWGLLAALLVALTVPIWLVHYVPLVDYPNHLARMYILHHYGDVESFHRLYRVVIEPIPNLAMDLIVPPLLYLFSVIVAGKLFLTATVVLFALGCHWLGRAIHGRPTWLALPCVFFSYNSMFLFGFVNYVFSLAMFAITLAVWLNFRKRWTAARIGACTALVFLSYLSHLAAYSFLGATIGFLTLAAWWQQRRIVWEEMLGWIPLVPPLIAFRAFMDGSGKVGQVIFNDPMGKLINSLSLVVSYNYVFDAVLLAVLLLAVFALAWRTRHFKVNGPVFAGGVMFLGFYLACPHVLFTSFAADARFIPPAALLLILAVRMHVDRRWAAAILGVVLVMFTARLGEIATKWWRIEPRLAPQVALLDTLPPGARVFPITLRNTRNDKNERPFCHLASYSTISRQTYLPTLFANKGQQPLQFRNEPLFAYVNDTSPQQVAWNIIFRDYDYIWAYHATDDYLQYLNSACIPVAELDGGVLFKIKKQ